MAIRRMPSSGGRSNNINIFMEISELPDEYREEMEAVLETAHAIHGDAYIQHVKFCLNLKSMLGMFIQNTSLDEHVDHDQFKDMTSTLCAQMTGSHADALDLTKEQSAEVLKTSDTITSIMRMFEDKLNKKGRH